MLPSLTSTTPKSHKTTLSIGSKIRTLEEYLLSAEDTWRASHPSARVRSVAPPSVVFDNIRTMSVWQTGDRGPYATPADGIPHIVISGMPASQYPRFMEFLYRCTMASILAERPHLTSSAQDTRFIRMVTMATAVRCGVWAAMSVTPGEDKCDINGALYFDKKKSALWMRKACMDYAQDSWLVAYDSVKTHMAHEAEIMQQLCIVAPIFMCMGATALTQRGEVYAAPYVERSVSSCLKKRMSPGAYAALHLDTELTWDLLKHAAVSGLPASAVKCWATDPLVAAGAQKRIAITAMELDRFAARELALSSGALTPGPMLNLADQDEVDGDDEDPVMRRVREMKDRMGAMTPEDDNVTLPTALGEIMSRPASPGAAHEPATVVPSRSVSPVPSIGQTHRDQIKAAVQHAASQGERAASELAFVRADETVRW